VARTAVLLLAAFALLTVACGGQEREGYAGYWQVADEATLGGPLLLRIDEAGDGRYAIAGLRFLEGAGDQARVRGEALVVDGADAGERGFRVEFTLSDDQQRLRMALYGPGKTAPALEVGLVPAEGAQDDLAEQLAAQEERANVLRVQQGFRAIERGIRRWAKEEGGYPHEDEVAPDGALARTVDPWPQDPYAGGPMTPGDGPGQFTYEQLDGGKAFRLAAHVAEGADFVAE
jgi:hypothetical protein